MSKGKKIYIVILLLITVLVTTFYFSYAIFSNTKEEHGKLNIVAGTLNYKIESSSLDNDSIMIPANTSKEIKIKLTSLNEVSSKYELYYVLDKVNENVSVGYSKDTKDNVIGTIDANKSKVITIIIRNDSNADSKISFKVIGGLINNELVLNDGNSLNQKVSLCRYEVGYVWNFDYTGSEQEFTTPCSGNYKLETWGAQGGSYDDMYIGGSGSYSIGNLKLIERQTMYINIGEGGNYCKTEDFTNSCVVSSGYNGGSSCATLINYSNNGLNYRACGSGGGATHIAFSTGLLSTLENQTENILIVSGGGGGFNIANYPYNCGIGGSGGGKSANDATKKCTDNNIGIGGTNVTGFSFGKGGSGFGGGGGGGGGFYGGYSAIAGGGGGSGYIGNSLLTNKAMYCYNCEESSEESTKTISTTCVSDTPTSNCSKQGNGYARITYLGD